MFSHRWIRVFAARPLLCLGAVAGLVAAALLPHGLGPVTRAILAWDIGILAYLGLAVRLFLTEPDERMEAHAAAQQEGEWTIFWLTVAAVMFSFAAILTEFASSHDLPAGTKSLHIGLVAGTLFLSWLMTQTTFAFRYAHEFYSRDNGGPGVDGGLDFPGETRPDYLDFLYFSLVVGMTFQVSDVQVTSRKLRRVTAAQGVLSFLFNTIILALSVNIAAGLL